MKVTIYHNPRCSKSRQALALLQEKSVEIEVIEYLKQPPKPSILKKLAELLQLRPEDMIRTKESKEAGVENLSDEELIAAIEKNPEVLERPIVVYCEKAVIARPPELIETLFD